MPLDPDIEKYCNLMEEIKRRIAVVDFFISGQGTALFQPPTLESASLQLRKVLELIAFGSLVANADAYTAVHSKVSKGWHAADLLHELEEVNPDFYPVPVVEVPSIVPAVVHQLQKRQLDYLAKDYFGEVYGRCGVMAHAANPYGKGIDYGYYLKMLPEWRIQIVNLLNNHEIHRLNRPGMYVIHMKEQQDDKVHWYKFEPPSKQG
jgi:hypothetical protein